MRKIGILAVVIGIIGIGSVGCMPADLDLNDLLNSSMKVANAQMSTLTAEEYIAIYELGAAFLPPGAAGPALTDAQAAAVVAFFVANNVNTLEDLLQIIASVETAPGSIQGLDALIAAYPGAIASPGNPTSAELEQLFAAVFGE